MLREKISQLIQDAGGSQKALAERAGVSQQTLSAILTGTRHDLRAEVVARLCRGLGLSPTATGKLLFECFPENTSDKIPDRG